MAKITEVGLAAPPRTLLKHTRAAAQRLPTLQVRDGAERERGVLTPGLRQAHRIGQNQALRIAPHWYWLIIGASGQGKPSRAESKAANSVGPSRISTSDASSSSSESKPRPGGALIEHGVSSVPAMEDPSLVLPHEFSGVTGVAGAHREAGPLSSASKRGQSLPQSGASRDLARPQLAGARQVLLPKPLAPADPPGCCSWRSSCWPPTGWIETSEKSSNPQRASVIRSQA
eukprot:CAMPEP_0181442484 /NCGR_PEP_ID=MMETSP1110-20121109/24052_1 /TAXON_ID=174948 /ORGANISM="Symbiodinium sp., Strain CCMP421" /LENGTH=229 /DNA_ID=CAMNT_0023566411 /DNA_START=100 /DNA_END=788 /DNA_ORIENTATION=+